MYRKPLDGRAELKNSGTTVIFDKVAPCDGYDPISLEYDVSGKNCGKLFEYFPDDSPGMYYDIIRENDEIKIGYLSLKPFNNGCSRFTEYFSFIKSEAAPDSDLVRVVQANNTAYAYIDNSLEVNIGDDYKNDLLRLTEGSALVNSHGFRVNCELIISSGDCYLPCGAFVPMADGENLTDENIYSFGKAVFHYLFGREPVTADCRFCSDWKRSDITARADINDKDFEILKNLLRHTLQVTRRSCFADFGKVKDELMKLGR